MCGVVSALLCLYCRSGCRASVVASALTFHPPYPAFYDFDYDREKDSYSFALADDVPSMPFTNYTVHTLRTKQNTCVPLILLRHPDAKYTIIYSHGNATDIGAMFLIFTMISMSLRVNVVGYDYSGYGISNIVNDKIDIPERINDDQHESSSRLPFKQVNPTEEQSYHDIEAVYNWCLESNLVIDPGKEIILYGQSVGSGPSCFLASKAPIAGLVLHSPIMSGLRVITTSRMLSCWDIYPNIHRIELVKAPVFVIHGQEDREVVCNHGIQLYEHTPDSYKTPPWWVPKKGHNDVLHGNEAEFIRRMRAFIELVDHDVRSPAMHTIPRPTSGSNLMIRDASINSHSDGSDDEDNQLQSF